MNLAESAWEAEYSLSGTGLLADQCRDWGYGELGGNGDAPRSPGFDFADFPME